MKNIVFKIRNDPNYRNANHKINTIICLGSLGLTQAIKGTLVAAFPTFLPIFFLSQFAGSTIQGGLSDVHKRSHILNLALIIIILTLIFLILTQGFDGTFIKITTIGCIILIGLGGNADVVGRAEIIDLHYHSNRRKIMSWTVFFEAFSWIIIGILIRFLEFNVFKILSLCIPVAFILLILSLIFNTDKTEDKKHLHTVYNEIKLIVKKNKKKLCILTFIIIVGECGYFFFFYNQESLIKNLVLLADSYISWFVGLALGCLILSRINKLSDYVCLIIGLVISLVMIITFIFGGMKGIASPKMFYFDSSVYLLTGIGSGFYLPCFYTIISKGHSIHFQGVLTGWVDSLRVFGDAITNASLLGLAFFPSYLPIIISILFFVIGIIIVTLTRKKIF